MDKLKRWLGMHVHAWTKWEKTDRLVHPETKGVVADCMTRKCTDCGLVQHHAAYYDGWL
jgi:hypothetical protein